MTPKQMQKRRENIIFGSNKNDFIYLGGIERFDNMSVDTLFQLMLEELIDPNSRQNNSPTVQEFYEFGDRWRDYNILFTGYIVEAKRDDRRVSIEGLTCSSQKEFGSDFIIALTDTFRYADRFNVTKNNAVVWYD